MVINEATKFLAGQISLGQGRSVVKDSPSQPPERGLIPELLADLVCQRLGFSLNNRPDLFSQEWSQLGADKFLFVAIGNRAEFG